ncbi:MAG: hypothetical protein AAB343_01830 [Patescibacteria group bacterium]
MKFGSIIEMLEQKRLELQMSQTQFCLLLAPPTTNPQNSVARYNEWVLGKRRVIPTWYPGIAIFFKMPVAELERMASQEKNEKKKNRQRIPFSNNRFSAEELQRLARVAEVLGRSLTIEMMIRLCREVETAGST